MKRILILVLALGIMVQGVLGASAQELNPNIEPSYEDVERDLFPTWAGSGVLDREGIGTTRVQGVLGSVNETDDNSTNIVDLIPRITQILIQIVAPLMFVTLVYAGIRFVIYRADDDKMEKSKNFFTNALVGLGIVLVSYSLLRVLYFLFST